LRGWGLVEVKAVDFSNELPDIEKAFRKELGFRGMLKWLVNFLYALICVKQCTST